MSKDALERSCSMVAPQARSIDAHASGSISLETLSFIGAQIITSRKSGSTKIRRGGRDPRIRAGARDENAGLTVPRDMGNVSLASLEGASEGASVRVRTAA